MGVAVAVVGVLVTIFNREFVRGVTPPRGRVARIRWFQPGSNGRVPILTIISLGWVIVGSLFVWVAATGANHCERTAPPAEN
jgi:hypothetical protein